MKIELKKLKHMASLSEETPCYTADVYVDGKLVAHTSNHGHGGCDMMHAAKGVDLEAVCERVRKELPKYKLEGYPDMDADLETECHTIVWDTHERATLKRHLKTKVLFIKEGANGVYQMPIKALEQARRNGHKVLNDMAFDDAFKAYKEHP